MTGKHVVIVPPRIVGMMCGVKFIRKQGDLYQLVYEDDTMEEARCILEDGADTFRIVSAVQSKRGDKANSASGETQPAGVIRCPECNEPMITHPRRCGGTGYSQPHDKD